MSKNKTIKTSKGSITLTMVTDVVDPGTEKKLEYYHVRLYENLGLLADKTKDVADVYTIWSYQRKVGKKLVDASAVGLLSAHPDVMHHYIITSNFDRKSDLLKAWKKAKYKNTVTFMKEASTNPFNRAVTSNKLLEELVERNLNTTKFAEITKKDYANVHNEIMRGKRNISIDQAIQYSKELGVDPVDLLFEKKQCHIWGKVDFLKTTNLEIGYSPGNIFQYYTDLGKAEVVEVPREFWRPDILAVRIISKASMYSNQIAFYYKSEFNPIGASNNNRLVVACDEVEWKDLDFKKSFFYLGIYEEHEGKINIKNPDPYSEEQYIAKNINPKFVAPVVALVRPGLVKRDVIAKEKIRDHHRVLEKTLEQDKTLMAMRKIQDEFNKQGKITNQIQKDVEALRKAAEKLTYTGSLYEEDKFRDLSKFLTGKFYDTQRKKAS